MFSIMTLSSLIACGDKEDTATTETSAEVSTEPATEPATEPSTEVSTEPATEPSAEVSTEPSTEASTEPSTEPPAEPPTLVNGGFEEDGAGWLLYPETASNYEYLSTGDGVYDPAIGAASSETFFTASEGNRSLKMWTANNLYFYQEYWNVLEGAEFTFSGKFFVSSLDPIGGEGNFGQLLLKAYGENYTELGVGVSSVLIDGTTVDEWQDVSATLVVPAGTTNVQVGVELVVGNNPVGALYVDDLQMTYTGVPTE